MREKNKKITRWLLYFGGSFFLIILVLVITLWIKSPGKPVPITDVNGKVLPGSISTIEKVELGVQEQYLIIRGADATKPVMLFLHGGPGFPELPIMKEANAAIENDFVMVYWEQLGTGKSYSEDIPVESMTIEQFISDTKELSEYLAKKFKQNKIYLMGHSWGSFLGILTANKYPELFHSYFGVGQLCNQYMGEKVAFDWIKEEAIKRNDKEAIETLSNLSFPDRMANGQQWLDYIGVQRGYVTKFGGGATHKSPGIVLPMKIVLNAKEYTLDEKANLMKGLHFSMEHLWPDMTRTNLFNEIDSLQIPVYIFQGKFDRQTPYSVAKEFFDQLKAPEKEFFTFEHSAHSPLAEEGDKFNAIVRRKIIGER